MRYAIIADIHGNLEALNEVLNVCRQEGVRRIFCAGDVVGYGANPRECLDIIRQRNIVCVAGNHDWAACGKIPTDNFNREAAQAVAWTAKQLQRDELDFLKNLGLVYRNEHFILVHGSLHRPEQFIYLTDVLRAADSFFLMDRPVCFIGHTHVPAVMVKDEEETFNDEQRTFNIDTHKKYIVNVGSVGQPRNYSPTASFCIFDPDLGRLELKAASYDVETAQQKILAAGLPNILATRLAVGT